MSDLPTPFRLFDLPQELQDAVFAFAYPEVEKPEQHRVIFKSDWAEEEEERRALERSRYVPKNFPPLQIDAWLVSRASFLAAARAWMRTNKSIFCASSDDYYGAVATRILNRENGLYIETVSQSSVDLCNSNVDFALELFADGIAACKHLTMLELIMDESFFSTLKDKYACEDELDDDDFDIVFESSGIIT